MHSEYSERARSATKSRRCNSTTAISSAPSLALPKFDAYVDSPGDFPSVPSKTLPFVNALRCLNYLWRCPECTPRFLPKKVSRIPKLHLLYYMHSLYSLMSVHFFFSLVFTKKKVNSKNNQVTQAVQALQFFCLIFFHSRTLILFTFIQLYSLPSTVIT